MAIQLQGGKRMRRLGMQLVVVGAVCGVMGLAGWSTVASGEGAASAVLSSGEASGSPGSLGGSLVTLGSPVQGEQAQAVEQARLASPEAVVAREESQSKYEGLDSEQAAKLAAEAFPAAINRPAGTLPPLPVGQRVVSYPTDSAAQVELGAGKHGVIESSEPIALETAPGHREPLNLGLAEVGGAFQPVRSGVDVRIPKRLGDGVQLTSTGITLTPVDTNGGALSGAEGVVDGATVVYANTQTDSDAIVKPTTAGFEADTLLRSVDSPDQLSFRVGLPAGASLLGAKNGSGGAEIVDEGAVIAVVSAPSAQDTEGVGVPVSMSVSGDSLVVSVDLGAGEYHYPIVVDPTVAETGGGGEEILLAETSGFYKTGTWGFYNAENPSNFTGYRSEKGVADNVGESVAAGQRAFFYYPTQGESKIYAVSAETEYTEKYDALVHFENALGIENVHAQSVEGLQTWQNEYGWAGATVCELSGCAVGNVTSANDTNEVFFMQDARESSAYNAGTSRMRKASVDIVQEAPPSVSFDTSESEFTYPFRHANALYGSKWVKTNQLNEPDVGVNATDPGLGVSEVKFSSPSAPHWVHTEQPGELGCTGIQCEKCFEVSCSSHPLTAQPTTGAEALPDGEDVVEATVKDPVGLSATTAKATVKIDNTPPYNLSISGLPPYNEIGYGNYKVKLSAVDGSGSIASSGVVQMTLAIDGKEVGSPHGSCSPGPCTATGEWTINGGEYAAGKHTITMTAIDGTGNSAKSEAPLTFHAASPVAVGPGSVEPGSGAFTLTSTDVSIAAPGGGLSVERSYQSRRMAEAIEGPFGPQWQGLDFSGDQSLAVLSNGSVVLTGSKGQQSLFTKEGSKFTPPTGDTSLTLTEEGASKYRLADQSGDVTTFTVPTGGAGTLLTPASREEAGHAGAVKYTFQTVGGVTEPTQALAPVPAGVACTTLVKGCRALTFSYASSTTATGEAPPEWGEYKGRLVKISFTAWDPTKKEMRITAVAQYSYDKQGRLRAEWDPRVSPGLKTTYGYDAEGHVMAVSPPGQQPWLLHYGTIESDASPGRLLSVTRPAAATTLGEGIAPANTELPKLSNTSPVQGTEVTVSTGVWTHSPLTYGYQWEQCNSSGGACGSIAGATNQGYTPRYGDEGMTLRVLVTAMSSGGTAIAETAVSAVVPYQAFPLAYSLSFGSLGSEAGKFKSPSYVAVGEYEGQTRVYVSDTGNNRVEEFTTSGAYVGSITGFKEPTGVVAAGKGGKEGYVWVADSGNKRVDWLIDGDFLYRTATTPGTGALGGLWNKQTEGEVGTYVAAPGENRIEMCWTGLGIYCEKGFGGLGNGNGKFKEPADLTTVKEIPFITDTGNDQVQEAEAGFTAAKFGEAGSGPGQFKEPKGIAADALGQLWVADTGNNRMEVFTTTPTVGKYVTQFGSTGSGAGQFKEPKGLAFDAAGSLYVVDSGNNRVEKWAPGTKPASPPLPAATPPNPGTSAVWTVEYKVPVSGASAPQQLTSTEVLKWGQKDDPVDATAIFPPDEPMGWPAKDYKRASVFYRDSKDRSVNAAGPSGGISTTEFNANNDVVRSLSPDNRARALKEGAKSTEASEQLDTQSTYNSEGTELQSTLGPQHTVKLASGATVEARDHQQYTYDEGAPTEGSPYRLATKVTDGALYAGKEEDVRTTTTSYAGQENLGWKLRKPTSVTTDPSGLKLTHTMLYEAATGNAIETRTPASSGSASAHDTQTIYYTTAANSTYPGCGEHAEWAGLPCQAQPAKQPETSGVPNLPVTTTTYNVWDEPEKTTEAVGSTTRTKTATYDAAGRLKTAATSSTVGTALPTVTDEYSAETGAPTTQSTSVEGKTKKITSVYNALGELTSYIDADENTATYNYDIDGRVEKDSDGKGTQTYTYDPTTGFTTKLVDSAAGTFTGSYDVEGNLLTEGYPDGLNANYTYNQTDKPVGLEYVKTTNCTEKCTWFSDAVVPSIHGQSLEQTSTLSHQAYTYDAAGRLTQVQNTPAGKGCTTRLYTYEEDTNRTSLTTREPGSKSECTTTGGGVEKHTYDTADRLTDTGIVYSTFGNITTLPAADAGGSALTSAYYTDNQLQSETQNGQTIGYDLDPAGRTRETVSTGKKVSDVVSHYAGPGSTPAWTANTSGEWTRNIPGISGGLGAVQNNGETPVLQLANLHGDIIATAYLSETATVLASTADTSEFGIPTTSLPPKYSWLGADEIPTELPSGIVDMGARSYVPQLGRFLQPDPRPGGSANAYTYTFGDPVNASDPSGEYTVGGPSETLINGSAQMAQQAAAQQAAENAAARAEAERKAREAEEAVAMSGPQYEEEWGEEEEYEEEEYEYANYAQERQAEQGESFGPGFVTEVDYNAESHTEDAVRLPFEDEESGSEYHTPGERCGSGAEGTRDTQGAHIFEVRQEPCRKHRPGWYRHRHREPEASPEPAPLVCPEGTHPSVDVQGYPYCAPGGSRERNKTDPEGDPDEDEEGE